MKYGMLGKHILLELLVPEGQTLEGDGRVTEKTQSGIILAKTEGKTWKKNKATVLSIGPKVEDVEVGDKVVFEEYAPTIIDPEKPTIFWVEEDHIVGLVIEE